MREQYPDDPAFRRAFLEAVQDYEVVRRRIDAGQAQPEDVEQEAMLRNQMEAFTDFQPLSVADVVKVPTWTPHALQHGVRVVEFQTATYERFIISFAQQVVTQDHWDSEHAISNMQTLIKHYSRVKNYSLMTLEHASYVKRLVSFDNHYVFIKLRV